METAIASARQVLTYYKNDLYYLYLICKLIVNSGYKSAWIGILKDRNGSGVVPAAESGFGESGLNDIIIDYDKMRDSAEPIELAAATGSSTICNNVPSDYAPWRNHAAAWGYNSCASIPLKKDGSIYGVLNVYSEDPFAFDNNTIKRITEQVSMVQNIFHFN